MLAVITPGSRRFRAGCLLGGVVLGLSLMGCGGSTTSEANWPTAAKKWHDRASASYHEGDFEDAQLASDNALHVDAKRNEIRLLAAKVALTRLDFDRAVQLTEGLKSPEAAGIRGRALWYSGKISEAADELERLVSDPDVRDSWAVDIAKVARRGIGRKPFTISGGLLAVTEMPRVGRSLVVPVEIDGEPALALIATGVSETVVDATAGSEPKWISIRFGGRLEVRDVPALTKDLSSYSRQLNAPIRALLGVNLLRHLRPTFDFMGEQFVVRSFDPPPPPSATLVPLSYVRGGGMVLRGKLAAKDGTPTSALLVDTTTDFPLVLDERGWSRAGVPVAQLKPVPGQRGISHGMVSLLTLGALEIPDVPALYGIPLAEIEKPTGVDLDGIIGAGLMLPFRVTLVEGGRTMWLEPMPMAMMEEPMEEEPSGEPPPAEPPQGGLTPPTLAPPSAAGPLVPSAPMLTPGAKPRSPSANAPR